MEFINYISSAVIPIIMAIIIIYGLFEKNKVYDTFVEGAKEGLEIVVKLFPTLLGIFVAIGPLRSSGILEFIIKFISPITNVFHIPSEIMPLAIIRPISGSASTAVATDIMTKFGICCKSSQARRDFSQAITIIFPCFIRRRDGGRMQRAVLKRLWKLRSAPPMEKFGRLFPVQTLLYAL